MFKDNSPINVWVNDVDSGTIYHSWGLRSEHGSMLVAVLSRYGNEPSFLYCNEVPDTEGKWVSNIPENWMVMVDESEENPWEK